MAEDCIRVLPLWHGLRGIAGVVHPAGGRLVGHDWDQGELLELTFHDPRDSPWHSSALAAPQRPLETSFFRNSHCFAHSVATHFPSIYSPFPVTPAQESTRLI